MFASIMKPCSIRPKKEINAKLLHVYNQWKEGSITTTVAMKMAGMGRTTFFRRVKEYEDNGT